MSTTLKRPQIAELLSLIALTILTLIAIKSRQITMFYVIYLFWMDELLKTVFDFFKYNRIKSTLQHPKVSRKIISSRFFMLCIYLVFIFVFFGLILDWKTEDAVISNFEVVMFKNVFFNFTILSIIVREVVLLFSTNPNFQFLPHHIFSKGVITLHVSIILGVFIWALFSRKLGNFNLDLGVYQTLVAIVPFLIIKCVFEILEIRQRHRQSKDLLVR